MPLMACLPSHAWQSALTHGRRGSPRPARQHERLSACSASQPTKLSGREPASPFEFSPLLSPRHCCRFATAASNAPSSLGARRILAFRWRSAIHSRASPPQIFPVTFHSGACIRRRHRGCDCRSHKAAKKLRDFDLRCNSRQAAIVKMQNYFPGYTVVGTWASLRSK